MKKRLRIEQKVEFRCGVVHGRKLETAEDEVRQRLARTKRAHFSHDAGRDELLVVREDAAARRRRPVRFLPLVAACGSRPVAVGWDIGRVRTLALGPEIQLPKVHQNLSIAVEFSVSMLLM